MELNNNLTKEQQEREDDFQTALGLVRSFYEEWDDALGCKKEEFANYIAAAAQFMMVTEMKKIKRLSIICYIFYICIYVFIK